jgi:Sec-independent protein translocase protein TatA
MGIGDWFKRFKRNAAEYEEYAEEVGPQEAGESQAERAAHEGPNAPQRSPSADESRGGDD